MATALRRQGVEVEVVTALPNYPTGSIFPDYRRKLLHSETWAHDIKVHRVWLAAAQGSGFRRLLSFASFAALLPLALQRVERPDVVFVNSSPLTFAPVALRAARRWKATPVLGISDLWPDGLVEIGSLKPGRVLSILLRLEAKMYREFSMITPVTDGIKTTLLSRKGVPESKLAFLPNGVDTELFHPDQEAVELEGVTDHAGAVFAFGGTMGYFQGLDVVIDAMDQLRDRHDIRFAFIGDGNERVRLEEEVVRRNLTESVIFRDGLPAAKFAGVLPAVRAGVVTLRDMEINRGARPGKTFPIMAAGRPVIFSGDGEMAEMVSDAKAGMVVAPADGSALADAIRTLADDETLADELGKNGRDLTVNRFGWDALVDSWLTTIKRLPELSEIP
ncbi:MAG: glycosyltransferase family 4 protein [Acidimicrobiales bacterium]|nr:glycosyltransferase family 4 protein [Acidimicrobiales bacterium]